MQGLTETVSLGPAFDQRREEIIELAAELFANNGYSQTSMNEIAKAAGLRKATLYHYFQSKTEMLVKIHMSHVGFLFGELDATPRKKSPPDERLRGVVDAIVRLMKTRPHFVRVFLQDTRELPPVEAASIEKDRTRYRRAVMQMMQDAIDQGLIRSDADPYYATMALFGISNWVYQWYERDPGNDPEHLADILWGFIWPGLRAT